MLFGCINFITNSDTYNSLYFQGGCWIEYPKIENMRMGESQNDFTLQFWVSGEEIDTNEAHAICLLYTSPRQRDGLLCRMT